MPETKWESILKVASTDEKSEPEVSEEDVKIEADVIITATILGFIGERYSLGQPCQFDIAADESDDKEKEFKSVLDAVSIFLNEQKKGLGNAVQHDRSPKWEPGALITGLPDGEPISFKERHQTIKIGAAKWIADRIADEDVDKKASEATFKALLLKASGKLLGNKPDDDISQIYYKGRGAYAGMIYDPKGEKYFVRLTRRVIDKDSSRWHPSKSIENWGLIKPGGHEDINLSDDLNEGYGPLPGNVNVKHPNRIGYIHGMCAAICECQKIDRSREPSEAKCIPFEMAIGKDTTKMASCFPCTTYMYAAGYPPSSIHLGRGESWVPPAPHLQGGEQRLLDMTPLGKDYLKSEYDQTVIGTLLEKWHLKVYEHMVLGVNYLTAGSSLVFEKHQKAVKELDNKLRALERDKGSKGGNLFLDALTIHDSELARLKRTLNIDKISSPKLSKAHDFSPNDNHSTQIASLNRTTFLNGMRVLFDKAALLTSVELKKKQ